MKRDLSAALVIGLAGSLATLACHGLGILRIPWGGHLVLAITAGATFLACGAAVRGRARAIDRRGELVGFAHLLVRALLVVALATPIAALGTYLFVTVVDPGHLDFLRDEATRQIEALELPAAQTREYLESVATWANPLSFALQHSLNTLTLGTFAAFVTAALFRGRS